MSTYVLKPADGKIPEGSYYKVVSMPEGNVVVEGECSGEVALNLDPGKYRYLIAKMIDGNSTPQTWTGMRGEFMHEVSEENWKRVATMKPKYATSIQASSGIRFNCGYSGCSFSTNSRYAIVKHEAEHQGVDVLTGDGLRKYRTTDVKQRAVEK